MATVEQRIRALEKEVAGSLYGRKNRMALEHWRLNHLRPLEEKEEKAAKSTEPPQQPKAA